MFYQRVRETDTAYASAASMSAVYITEALIVIDGEITITGKPQYGEQLAVELSGFIGDTSQISCQWYADGTLIEGATELIYTVTQEDMGKTLTVRLTGLGAYTGELECSSVILAYVLGDTDGDCLVTDQDALALNRYLAGWQVQVDLQAADVDGDDAVSDWDAILLERYLAGWEIELLSPDTE